MSKDDEAARAEATRHPVRARVLGILTQRTASPVQVSKELQLEVGAVAYHVRTLASLGLVELVDERPVRGAVEHLYRARPTRRGPSEAWSAAPAPADEPIEALDAVLRDAQEVNLAGGFDSENARLRHWTGRLDAKGYAALARACNTLHDEAARIAAGAAKRLDAGAEPCDVGLASLSYKATPLTDRSRQR